MRLIETRKDVAEGTAWLVQAEPRFAQALTKTGPPPLRRTTEGFTRLLSVIVSQQVSLASAAAIWNRIQSSGLTNETAVLAAGEAGLRKAGLSRPKATYALALAKAQIDYPALRHATDAEVITTLTAVKGIGLWSAEIYAMFSLGRADVFAAGDLALQVAAQDLFALETRPKEKELRALSLAWSPWRSVAARLLFAYYRVIKGREGLR